MPKRPSRVAGTLAELMVRLDTTAGGLSSAQARSRHRGLATPARARWRRLASLFEVLRGMMNPLIAVLAVAGIASAVLGQPVQAAVIGAMVVMSGAIDAWQTVRSTRAVERLQAQMTPTATVLRDGVWHELRRVDLVAGDVVRLAAGDLVPGDARLLEATDLHVQQAALTGESLPVEKMATSTALAAEGPDAAALVYLGTSVVSGSATAVVFATGADTAFGDVVAALAARPDETEFERGTRRFGMMILQTVVFLVLFVLVVNVAFGRDAMESILFSVALAVGLTPEFLPMISTVTLAQGAIRMARDKVIVKHLPAIQNLGSIDILCCDKTGTLTSGTMSLAAALGPFGATSSHTLELARMNSRFQTGIASPLDVAILAGAPEGSGGYTKTDEIPFDFDRRRMSIVGSHQSQSLRGDREGAIPRGSVLPSERSLDRDAALARAPIGYSRACRVFIDRYAKENAKSVEGCTMAALELLMRYTWPGNVRELENAIERAVVLTTGTTIEAKHLPVHISPAVAPSGMPRVPGASLAALERYAILETLKATGGSTSRAAAMLGLSPRTIQYRLHDYSAAPRSQTAVTQ